MANLTTEKPYPFGPHKPTYVAHNYKGVPPGGGGWQCIMPNKMVLTLTLVRGAQVEMQQNSWAVSPLKCYNISLTEK